MKLYRTAKPIDEKALTALEQAAFGDEEACCRRLFEDFAGYDRIFVAEEGDTLSAMALTVPVTLRQKRGLYLYALTTRQEQRQKGVMQGLLTFIRERAEQEGFAFLCLIPASESLFSYYQKQGYTTEFFRQKYALPIDKNLLATAEFDDVNVFAWPRLREQFCTAPYVQPTQKALAAILTDYYSMGGFSVRTQDGYGFFRRDGERLLFDELFARDERAVRRLLEACRQKTGCLSARILTDSSSLLGYGNGKRIPYGMVLLLQKEPMEREPYMGMMLDI